VTVIVFDLGNCSSVELNSNSGEFPGEGILRERWPAALPGFGHALANDIFPKGLSPHAGEITFCSGRKCSKLEHYGKRPDSSHYEKQQRTLA
jgi:hypothetical protein